MRFGFGTIARTVSLLVGMACAALTGCASAPQSPHVTIGPGMYEAAFDATRDTLREHEFELERVDARNGVISTAPRQWAGFATPWIPHATDVESGVVGLMQHELRSCRVTFRRSDRQALPDSAEASLQHGSEEDLRLEQGELVASVEVLIYRVQRPGRRIGAPSVRLRSQAIDPELVESGLQPQFVVQAGRDESLANRLAQMIDERMDSAASPVTEAAKEIPTGK